MNVTNVSHACFMMNTSDECNYPFYGRKDAKLLVFTDITLNASTRSSYQFNEMQFSLQTNKSQNQRVVFNSEFTRKNASNKLLYFPFHKIRRKRLNGNFDRLTCLTRSKTSI